MSEEQMAAVQEALGRRLRAIADRAVAQANRYLGVYGMEAALEFRVFEKGKKPNKELDWPAPDVT
jgi:hypothetical protein